jgi:hypothetical protein
MKFQTFLLGLSAAAVPFLSTSCSDDDDDPVAPPPPPPTSQETATFDSGLSRAWLNRLCNSIKTAAFPPTLASRTIAYSGVTFYEAVVPGMPDHQSLAGQLNGLSGLPVVPDGVHHWPAVANTALAAVMRSLFAANATVVGEIDALEALKAQEFADAGVEQDVLDRSVVHGTDLATAILAWAAEDGLADWNNCAYTVPTGPGFWEPTFPAFAAPHQPCWGKLRTFALAYGAECIALPPTPFSEVAGSKFYLEAQEVQQTVDNLTVDEIAIAQFWADNPTQSFTPPGHWISVLEQCSLQNDYALDVSAEAFARIGIAVGDAFISCWDMKYFYNLQRPITYIRSPTGLNDPTWLTAPGIGGGNINTPNFPEHTSGHSVQSGAVAEVLTELLGVFPYEDDTHAALGLPARSFDSFFDAADEAAISRLYGGIHFLPAIERGVEQGRCIGNVINTQIHFTK